MNIYAKTAFAFLGILIMAVCATVQAQVLLNLKEILLTNLQRSEENEATMGLAVVCGSGGALLLTLLALQGHFRRALHLYFASHVFVLCIGAAAMSSFPEVSTAWSAFIAVWITAASPAMLVLTWGLANQLFRFRTAALLYPLIGLLAMVAGSSTSILGLFLGELRGLEFVARLALGALFSFFGYLSFIALSFFQEEKPPYAGELRALGLLCFALLLASFSLFEAASFRALMADLSSGLSNVSEISTFNTSYTFWKGAAGLYAQMLAIGLGAVLFMVGPKAWRPFFLALTLLALLVGGVFVALYAGYLLFIDEFARQVTVDPDYAHLVALSGAHVFYLFLAMTALSIKELVYFAMSESQRFSLKIGIELILVPLVLHGWFYLAENVSPLAPTELLTLTYTIAALLILLGGAAVGSRVQHIQQQKDKT